MPNYNDETIIKRTGTTEIDFSAVEENEEHNEDPELDQFDVKYEALLYLGDVLEGCCLKKIEPVPESQQPLMSFPLFLEQVNDKEVLSRIQQCQNVQPQEQKQQQVQRLTPLSTIKPTLSYSQRSRTATFCEYGKSKTLPDNTSSKRYMNRVSRILDLLDDDNKLTTSAQSVGESRFASNRNKIASSALGMESDVSSDDASDGPTLTKKHDDKSTKYCTEVPVQGKLASSSSSPLEDAKGDNKNINSEHASAGVHKGSDDAGEFQALQNGVDKSEVSESADEGFKEDEFEALYNRKPTRIERDIMSQTEKAKEQVDEAGAKTVDAEQLKKAEHDIAETVSRLRELQSGEGALRAVGQNEQHVSIAVIGSKQTGKSLLASRFAESECPEGGNKQPVESYCALCTLDTMPVFVQITVVHEESRALSYLDAADGVIVCVSSPESFAKGMKLCRQSGVANSRPIVFVATHVDHTDEKRPVGQIVERDAIYFEVAPLSDAVERVQYPFVWLIKRISEKRKLAAVCGGAGTKLITRKMHKSKPSLLNDDFSFDPFDPQPSQTPDEALNRFIEMDIGYQQRLNTLVEVVPVAMEHQVSALNISTIIGNAKELLASHRNALNCIFSLIGRPIRLVDKEMDKWSPARSIAATEERPSFAPRVPISSPIHCVLALATSAEQYLRYAAHYAKKVLPLVKKLSSSQKYKQICLILAEKDALCGCTFEQLLKLPVLRLYRLIEQLYDLENTLSVSKQFAAVNVVRRWLEEYLKKHADAFDVVWSKKDKDDVKRLVQALKPEITIEENKALVTAYVNNVFQNQFHQDCFEQRKLIIAMNRQIQQTLVSQEVGTENTTREVIKIIVHFGETLLKHFIGKAPSKRFYRKCLVSIVTEFCISSAYPLLFAKYRERYYQDDMKVCGKIAACQSVTPASFGIKEAFYEKDLERSQTPVVPFRDAIRYFKMVKDSKTPVTKCDALIRATDAITEVSTAPIAADDLLPIFAYILIQANCSSMFSESKFIENFLGEDEIIGREGYVVTTLQTALAFLSEFTPEDEKGNQKDMAQ